ncbi:hypothetical protein [Sporocytophaga myxococcoides]|uniref:hypothetical protein n=1 Tax=Sporocytophaga myxococcoides TaxID=153721 RepID=UPI0003FE109E|nr:hypothetical protein [Sporocytophaga myxococcoides]
MTFTLKKINDPNVYRSIEIIRVDDKYFIEIGEYENIESFADLTLLLASRIDFLKERVDYLESKIKKFDC